MALATLLLPAAVLAVSAALSWGADAVGLAVGRYIVAAAAWLSLAVLAAVWLAGGRGLVEFTPGITTAVAPLRLRMDAVVVLFQVAVLVPAALLLTFQSRSSREAAIAGLAAAAALLCLEGGSLLWTAIGLGVCMSLVLIDLHREEQRGSVPFWGVQTIAWLLLVWTAVLLEAAGGTSVFGAIPVTALRLPAFAVLAAAAVLCAGVLPVRTWVSEAWTRRRLEAGTLAIALLVPIGFYLLVRAYGMGAGQWPAGQANLVVAAIGSTAAVGAAVRAQAATTRRGFLAEAVPLGSGVALLAVGLGTPLGLVAALMGVLSVSIVAGLAPLVPSDRGPVALLAIAVPAGAPPTVVFGSLLLSVQAALEAGVVQAFLGLAVVAAWLLGLAAAARAVRLRDASADTGLNGSRVGSLVTAVVAVAAGVGLTLVVALLAIPAAAEVMPPTPVQGQGAGGVSPSAILGAGSLGVSTASGGWSSALLAGPIVLLALVAVAAAPLLRWHAARTSVAEAPLAPAIVELEPPPAPLFTPPLAPVPARAAGWLKAFRLPAQYRSLFRPALMEAAVARSKPWLWVAVTVVLTIAVTR
ncbi:MAG TPA: hypothetical protein VKI99_19075 [Candidatus Dormibacteraeota bacterium]|nr:hypothetical protein [Candidatus Dormibacteraeota bacterium]